MRGIRGLILALAAAAVGGICNWAYLANRAPQKKPVSFIGVKDGVALNLGDRLTAEHLEEVQIPQQWVGNLRSFARLYEELGSVVDSRVSRPVIGPALLLQQDTVTPPPDLKLTGPNEVLLWVPIETRGFVPSLIVPGEDLVSFVVFSGRSIMAPPPGKPEEVEPGAEKSGVPATGPTPTLAPGAGHETVGPFKVLALGNRLARTDTSRAARQQVLQENVIGILAKMENGKLEARAARLLTLLEATGFRQVWVAKHARQTAKEGAN